jgi:RNA polymerase sigma factor (sigma-70 family)
MFDNVRRFRRDKPSEISAADLVRKCGEKLTDRELWTQFQERFQGLIFLYVMRCLQLRSIADDVAGIVPDLTQNVYLKLVQHDGRALRAFRGTTEFSVRAFLTRTAESVVHDYRRSARSEKRHGIVIPIDAAREAEASGKASPDMPELDSGRLSSILTWIDMERVIEGEADQKNARRDALIFQLHYINGLTSAEIAGMPGFRLTESGVQTILARLVKRIQS